MFDITATGVQKPTNMHRPINNLLLKQTDNCVAIALYICTTFNISFSSVNQFEYGLSGIVRCRAVQTPVILAPAPGPAPAVKTPGPARKF